MPLRMLAWVGTLVVVLSVIGNLRSRAQNSDGPVPQPTTMPIPGELGQQRQGNAVSSTAWLCILGIPLLIVVVVFFTLPLTMRRQKQAMSMMEKSMAATQRSLELAKGTQELMAES